MTRDLVLLPEEIELARYQEEQARLEEQVTGAELELETAKVETAAFQRRYYQAVGRLYARLDELAAQIAEVRAKQEPEDRTLKEKAQAARGQADKSATEAGLAEAQPEPAPDRSPELKQAYRRAVKLMHPDLAISEHERQRRTNLMAKLNNAYERGDLVEVERLIEAFGQDPEFIVSEDVGSRIVKAIRRIAQLKRRLAELGAELEALRRSDGFELRETVEAAEARGEDPIGELAAKLKRAIDDRQRALEMTMNLAEGL